MPFVLPAVSRLSTVPFKLQTPIPDPIGSLNLWFKLPAPILLLDSVVFFSSNSGDVDGCVKFYILIFLLE
jgi:hypothetical protein